MRRALVDTDILSEVMRGRNPAVISRARSYESEFQVFTISAVSLMELVKGLHRRGRTDFLAGLMREIGRIAVLAFDQDTAELAGRMAADLESRGQPIGRADPMIAATAVQHGLVTGNTEHFSRIAVLGYPLVLEDWRTGTET